MNTVVRRIVNDRAPELAQSKNDTNEHTEFPTQETINYQKTFLTEEENTVLQRRVKYV